MRGEVRADEAQGGALQHELDGDAALVAVHAQQPRALAPHLHARDVRQDVTPREHDDPHLPTNMTN